VVIDGCGSLGLVIDVPSQSSGIRLQAITGVALDL